MPTMQVMATRPRFIKTYRFIELTPSRWSLEASAEIQQRRSLAEDGVITHL